MSENTPHQNDPMKGRTSERKRGHELPRTITEMWAALGAPTASLPTARDSEVSVWEKPRLDHLVASITVSGGATEPDASKGEAECTDLRIIIAARLAREEDVELRIGHQILECLEAAAMRGYRVVAVVSAVGVSGSLEFDDRVDLRWILDRFETGDADAALFQKPLRMTRRADVAAALFEKSNESGGAVHFAGAIDPAVAELGGQS